MNACAMVETCRLRQQGPEDFAVSTAILNTVPDSRESVPEVRPDASQYVPLPSLLEMQHELPGDIA